MQDLPIENLIELNKHSERLLAGMYEITKLVKTQELQVIQSSDIQKKYKSGKKPAPLPRSVNVDETQKALTRPVNILLHLRQFQTAAYDVLVQCGNKSQKVSLTETYPFTVNVMTLYTNYVKLGLLIQQIPELTTIVNVYRACVEAKTKKDDPELVSLYEFLHDRDSLKPLESELQCLNEQFTVFAKGIAPVLEIVLRSGNSFPWKMLSLADNPTTMLESECFILTQYLVMFHLSDICEMLICFFSVSSIVLMNESKLCQLFTLLAQYCLSLQIYADIYIDLKSMFNSFKKIKDKKFDMDTGFFEIDDDARQKTCLSREVKRKRLAFYINNFLSAVSVDASLLCTKFTIAFALIGFSAFEIRNAFIIKSAKPSIESFKNDISELLYEFTRLTTTYLNSIPDIQRFFIYNIHEFDAPFLDTLTHSFTLSQSVYDSLSMLIEALRIVDISEFDNNVTYDLTPCLALIYSIFQAFSGFSLSHGTSHLVPLFQLLSGVFFRTNLYQNTFSVILKISKINTFWCFIDSIQSIAKDINIIQSKYNIVILQMCHYYGMDVPAINEISSLPETIKKHFNEMFKLIKNYVKSWAVHLQNNTLETFRNQMSSKNILKDNPDVAGEESKVNNRESLSQLESNIQKICKTLLIAQEIGVIKIGQEEIDISKEICSKASEIFLNLFDIKGEPPAPTEFLIKLRTAKSILQRICSCSSLGYLKTIGDSMNNLTFVDSDEMGVVAKCYCDGYKKIIQEVSEYSYYSNSYETLVLLPGKQQKYQPAQYLSIPALSALKEIIGVHGCKYIRGITTKMINSILESILNSVSKAAKSLGNSYYCNYSDSVSLLQNICRLGFFLQVRKNLTRTIGKQILYPHQDNELMKGVNDLIGSYDLTANSDNSHFEFLHVIASLFSLSYWESAEYDILNDSFKDNSHLIANVLDLLIGHCIYAKKTKDFLECYTYFFSCVHKSINVGNEKFKSNKKGSSFPVHLLIILADQVVKVSSYADYSTIEQAFSYRLIRQYYSEVFNHLKNENQKSSK